MTKKDKKSGQRLNGKDITLKTLISCTENRVHPKHHYKMKRISELFPNTE